MGGMLPNAECGLCQLYSVCHFSRVSRASRNVPNSVSLRHSSCSLSLEFSRIRSVGVCRARDSASRCQCLKPFEDRHTGELSAVIHCVAGDCKAIDERGTQPSLTCSVLQSSCPDHASRADAVAMCPQPAPSSHGCPLLADLMNLHQLSHSFPLSDGRHHFWINVSQHWVVQHLLG